MSFARALLVFFVFLVFLALLSLAQVFNTLYLFRFPKPALSHVVPCQCHRPFPTIPPPFPNVLSVRVCRIYFSTLSVVLCNRLSLPCRIHCVCMFRAILLVISSTTAINKSGHSLISGQHLPQTPLSLPGCTTPCSLYLNISLLPS